MDTEQSFSISKEKALEKLAAFQLPFKGAWALKIVQCAVAGGFTSLKIDLSVKVTTFTFEGSSGFSLAEVGQAFFDPNYSARPDLCHLVAALRVRGYNEMHPFWLTLAGESQAMVWDGEAMRITEQKPDRIPDHAFQLTFSNLPKGESMSVVGLFTEIAGSGRNAEITKVLSNFAFACPIPLTLDGRRIDALQNDPQHGWSPESQLLMIGFRDGPLPALPLPRHTWAHTVPHQVTVDSDLQLASAKLRQLTNEKAEHSLAYLFSAHIKRVKSGKNYVWKDSQGVSTLHWVLDGVIVQQEALTDWPEFCSAACFVNASGIPTDITGFRLQSSKEKKRRTATAKELLSSALDDTAQLDFEEMGRVINKRERTVGGVMVIIGTVCLVMNPFIGLVVGGLGAFSFVNGSSEARKRKIQVSDCVRRLKLELGKKQSDGAL